jgi:hypothetical protein
MVRYIAKSTILEALLSYRRAGQLAWLVASRQQLAFPPRDHVRVELNSLNPLRSEGAGNAGCWPQPMARQQTKKLAAVTTRFSQNHPAFPARWF